MCIKTLYLKQSFTLYFTYMVFISTLYHFNKITYIIFVTLLIYTLKGEFFHCEKTIL
ncbi:hypothetical protein HMPREF0083_05167 [Aneurinibacillus aneurinilyticus ATCC 12856]|uniref:Uncharacterized protein n=1 Tax=Aneurinibacillus aneurinilyticus ATCC 12856 TaxID=649747 RepID=U1WVV7_ANEAE|nr:hypothetical protein HMPREF0083_05167 [Aneurinibacillus aneurinilyticus ATCC 12856]